MAKRQLTLVALTLLFGVGLVRAQDVPCVSIAGPEVAKRTEQLMKSYQWGDSLDALREKAQKEKKLIFWLQLVGELNGGL